MNGAVTDVESVAMGQKMANEQQEIHDDGWLI